MSMVAVELQGQSRGSQSVFEVHGTRAAFSRVAGECRSASIVNGDMWIEAKSAVCLSEAGVGPQGRRAGWAGAESSLTLHPWKKYAATLPPRARPAGTDTLTLLLTECGRRAIPAALTFKSDWTSDR